LASAAATCRGFKTLKTAMTWVVRIEIGGRFQILSDFREFWPARKKSLQRALEIVDIFDKGRHLLKPEDLPDKVPVAKAPDKLPVAFITMNMMMIVQEPVRELIEQFDRGLHQFLPIRVEHKATGETPRHRCFVLNIHIYQRSIVDAGTKTKPSPAGTKFLNWYVGPKSTPAITIDLSKLSGINLWREERYSGAPIFISDALHAAFTDHELEFFETFPVRGIN
jgi:hypothetical protein